MATQFNPIEPSDRQKFQILKIQDGGGRHLEKSKNRHVVRGLTESIIGGDLWLVFLLRSCLKVYFNEF